MPPETTLPITVDGDCVRLGTALLRPSEAMVLAAELITAAHAASEVRWERVNEGGRYDRDGVFAGPDHAAEERGEGR